MPMSCKITFQSEFNCLVVASLSVWHFSVVVQRKISQICKNICHFVKFHQNFVKFVLVKDQTYWVIFSSYWHLSSLNVWTFNASYGLFLLAPVPQLLAMTIDVSFHKKIEQFWWKLKELLKELFVPGRPGARENKLFTTLQV